MQEFATRYVARVGSGTDGTPIAAYGNGRIVVRVSSSSPMQLVVSSDLGLSWQSVELPDAYGFGYVDALSFDGEVFVLSGLYQIPSYIPMVATSPDGVNWQLTLFEERESNSSVFMAPGLKQRYPDHYGGGGSSPFIRAFDGFWITQAKKVVNSVSADFDTFISFNRGARWQLVEPPSSVPQEDRNIGASFDYMYAAYGMGFSVVQLSPGSPASFHENFSGLLVKPATKEIQWVPQTSIDPNKRGWFADRAASELVTLDGHRLSSSGVWRDDEAVLALSGGLERYSFTSVVDSRKQGSDLTTVFSEPPNIGIQQFSANTGWHAIDGVSFVRPDPSEDVLERVGTPNYPSVASALASVYGASDAPNCFVFAVDGLWVHLVPVNSGGGYLVFHTIALSKSQFWTNKVGTYET